MQTIAEHVGFWRHVASLNGWEVRSMTLWVNRSTNLIEDSVGVRDGNGTLFVKDWETDEVTHEFVNYLGTIN